MARSLGHLVGGTYREPAGRPVGARRWILCAGTLLAVAFAAPPAAASSPSGQALVGPSVFYKVTYSGTAQLASDGQDSCDGNCFSGPFHVSATFQWTATFPAVALSVTGASASAPAAGQQLSGGGDETDTDCTGGDCQAEHCTDSFSAPDPGAPDLSLAGQLSSSALTLKIDAPWRPDPASLVFTGLCQAAGPYPTFPDAFRAVTSIPISQLDTGTITRPVSSYDSGAYQLPPDCTAQAQADNSEVTTCTQSVLWHGTVTLTPDCVSDAGRIGGLSQPPCIKKKQKDDAAKAAANWHEDYEFWNDAAKINCHGSRSELKRRMCLVDAAYAAASLALELNAAAVADDPPDPNYTAVARPRPSAVRDLGKVRRVLPATYRLIQRYLQISGLAGALVTSQNRASGAFLAASNGDQTAGRYVAIQDQAVLRYAGQAVHLLAGQHRLALQASAELRRLTSRVHGRKSQRLISGIRRVASSLTSRRATMADRLATSALDGIGR
jgi:hypothetical protein